MHCNAQISALHQHEAATHGKAIHRGDHGFFQTAVIEGVFQINAPPARAFISERFLHILTRAKATPGAGQNGDLKPWIGAKGRPDARQFQAHFMVQRIEPFRAVHAHHQNLPVGFGFNNGHGVSP